MIASLLIKRRNIKITNKLYHYTLAIHNGPSSSSSSGPTQLLLYLPRIRMKKFTPPFSVDPIKRMLWCEKRESKITTTYCTLTICHMSRSVTEDSTMTDLLEGEKVSWLKNPLGLVIFFPSPWDLFYLSQAHCIISSLMSIRFYSLTSHEEVEPYLFNLIVPTTAILLPSHTLSTK